MLQLYLADQPFPEPERFCVRIVDAKDLYALIDPEQRHVAQRIPQRAGIFRGEVGVDDILVFFRRVFGIAHRAVGPALEPLRVLLQPRMIGRALHGEVECDLHVVLLARRHQGAEILQRAELRVHGVMAAFGGSDRIGTAGIAFLGLHRIVAALAVGLSDRVDRREIHHVEAHRRDIRQPRDAIPERAVLPGHRALAARHHLVPCTVAGARPVDHQGKQL